MSSSDIRNDPAVQRLLERMPEDVAASFTEPQLAHLRVALGARQWGKHAVDLRGTLGLGRWRYYYVVLAGRNSRSDGRQGQLSLWLTSALLSVVLIAAFGFILVVLYLLKSALGIDVFADYSFGVWDWFVHLFD